jgi:hypothetical protein
MPHQVLARLSLAVRPAEEGRAHLKGHGWLLRDGRPRGAVAAGRRLRPPRFATWGQATDGAEWMACPWVPSEPHAAPFATWGRGSETDLALLPDEDPQQRSWECLSRMREGVSIMKLSQLSVMVML